MKRDGLLSQVSQIAQAISEDILVVKLTLSLIGVVKFSQSNFFFGIQKFSVLRKPPHNQSISSIIDHPKMPRCSKRANLLKELEAVAIPN